MSYEEEDTRVRMELLYEEEDACHMRRRIHVCVWSYYIDFENGVWQILKSQCPSILMTSVTINGTSQNFASRTCSSFGNTHCKSTAYKFTINAFYYKVAVNGTSQNLCFADLFLF